MTIDNLEQFFNPSAEGGYSGWRCEGFSAGPESGASVGEVVKHEREVNGKDVEVSEELLGEIDKAGLWARDVLWLCKTAQEAVMRYGEASFNDDYDLSEEAFNNFKGDLSEANEVVLSEQALVLGTDDDGGWLVLMDASQLSAGAVERFKGQRRLGSAIMETKEALLI